MSSSTLRRLAAALLITTASLGVQAAATTPAFAADVKDRVITDRSGNVLAPDRSASGAVIRSVPRIGAANATPDSQVWQAPAARQRGTFNLVFVPSLRDGGVQLCLDVRGDSTEPGAPLVLRPCDGTDSQAWKNQINTNPTGIVNSASGLLWELVDGRLVQNGPPARSDADFRQRARLQQFSISPKSFGIGGA
jgi:hypothetical protein